jgi:hypothetical protein
MIVNMSEIYRNRFEKEKGIPHNVMMGESGYMTSPTWNYVCWLETKLQEAEEKLNRPIKASISYEGSGGGSGTSGTGGGGH